MSYPGRKHFDQLKMLIQTILKEVLRLGYVILHAMRLSNAKLTELDASTREALQQDMYSRYVMVLLFRWESYRQQLHFFLLKLSIWFLLRPLMK